MSEVDLDELRSELHGFANPAKAEGGSAKEQRIIAGFEEIERFVAEHGRVPQHGEGRDIFERLYAVRLDRLRSSAECRAVLHGRDSCNLLRSAPESGMSGAVREDPDEFYVTDTWAANEQPGEEELLAALRGDGSAETDLAVLKYVRSREEIRAAEEVAKRNLCEDFESFRPIFEEVRRELAAGERRTVKYKENAEVVKGDLFILDGQQVLVVAMGEEFLSEYGRPDRRLRVIYDNGTESDLLVRSLQRALNKDKSSRRITAPDLGPLFSGSRAEDDLPTGHIYVLRSKSTHPFVAEHRAVLHKIGVTGGDVKARISGAKKDPTYLLAEVETVAAFKLANINRNELELLLHRFFACARLDLALKDRFGGQVEPREWFLVPLAVIEEAIRLLMDGTLHEYRFDVESARIVKHASYEA